MAHFLSCTICVCVYMHACVCVCICVCVCVFNMLIYVIHKDNGTFGSSVRDEAISVGCGFGVWTVHTHKQNTPAVCIRTDVST